MQTRSQTRAQNGTNGDMNRQTSNGSGSGSTMQINGSVVQNRLQILSNYRNQMGKDYRGSMGDVIHSNKPNKSQLQEKRNSLAVSQGKPLDEVRIQKQAQIDAAQQRYKREMREYLKQNQNGINNDEKEIESDNKENDNNNINNNISDNNINIIDPAQLTTDQLKDQSFAHLDDQTRVILTKAVSIEDRDIKPKESNNTFFGIHFGNNGSKKKQKKCSIVQNEKYHLYSYYKAGKQIGDGAYATVIDAVDRRNTTKVAIKKNRGVFNNISDAKRILREIKLLCHFNHINIMPLLSVIPPEHHERNDFNDVYLVMPKMDMTLHKVIRKQKLTQKHIQWILYQVLRGCEYMHSAGVIHRDLKPDNILVNATDCIVKITDFGLARGVLPDNVIIKLTEYVVTRWYRAPEVMCCSRQYGEQIDTWSVGCIAAEFYHPKKLPVFQGRNHIDQLNLILDLMGTPEDLTWITTPDAKEWIKRMKKKKPKDLSKEFPSAPPLAIDFISKMLQVNPHKRLTVKQALKHPWIAQWEKEFNGGGRYDYQTCPKFDLSFEFEQKITTKFGVKHMMYEELINFKKNRHKKLIELQQQRMQIDKERAQQQTMQPDQCMTQQSTQPPQ